MKNLKISIIFIFLLIIIITTSCTSNNTDNKNDLNPFADINNENMVIKSEYGHSPYNFPEDYMYYYQGGVLEIPYMFYGGRVDSEVGLYIFIDGIIQPYFISDSIETTYEYIHMFDIESNSEKKYILNILPTVGTINDYLKLNFVCVDFPNLINANESIGELESIVELQNMSTTISWTLSFLENIPTDSILSLYDEAKIKTISETIQNDYEENNDTYFEFDSNSEESNIIISNTNKSIKFVTYGEIEGNYRTTIFINNSPVIIDSNNIFFEHKINKNEKYIYEFEFNKEYLEECLDNTNVLYAISINLSNSKDINQMDVFKTPSKLLIDQIA